MAKPDPWRLTEDAYPHKITMDTRFQDVDLLGHINNVAVAAMFETARVHFNAYIGIPPRTETVRRLVASLEINYLNEAHFPEPMTMTNGLGRVGRSSWIIESAAFQRGKCVATCDTVIVMRGAKGAEPISDELRANMEKFATRRP